eukprot:scaffold574_cov155-Skeletonema_menzelii.AAC.5
MVFFETSNPAQVGTKGATDDEEPGSFSFSCLSPKRWKKVGENNNELADVIDDERLDKNAKAPKEEEEEREGKETNESEEVSRAAASDDAPTSGEACVSADNSKHKEVAQDGDDEDEKEDEVEVPVTDGAEEVPVVTFAAEQEDAVASPTEVEVQKADEVGGLLRAMPKDKDAGKSLLNLAKTKPKTPKRALFDDIPDDESEASIEVLFRYMGCTDQVYGERPTISATTTFETTGTEYYTVASGVTSGDASDLIANIDTLESVEDDDDAKINTNEATTTNGDLDDVLLSPSGNLLIDADENGDNEVNEPMDIDRGNENEKEELFSKELTPPDDQLEDSTPPDEQLDDATPPVNEDKKVELFSKELTPPDDQLEDSTPPVEQLDDATPPVNEDEKKEIFNKVLDLADDQRDNATTTPDDQPVDSTFETSLNDGQVDDKAPIDGQVEEITPNDEESGDDAPLDIQVDGTDEQVLAIKENDTKEQISSAEAKPALNLLAVDTKLHESSNIPAPEDPRSAEMDKLVTRLSHTAMSPSVRKAALALHNVPKYPTMQETPQRSPDAANKPTTDYVDETESGDDENASKLPSATDQGNDTDKEVKQENTLLDEQGKKEVPATTSNESGTLSKVEEMDRLIKSTRAWLEKQKAERKAAERNLNVKPTEEKVMDNTDTAVIENTKKKAGENAQLTEENVMDKTASLKNTMKKLDITPLEMKSPISTKTLSSAKPLSPRTLDTLLVSRKTTPSDGPKKSILEQLEEIRKKQRERENLSSLSS